MAGHFFISSSHCVIHRGCGKYLPSRCLTVFSVCSPHIARYLPASETEVQHIIRKYVIVFTSALQNKVATVLYFLLAKRMIMAGLSVLILRGREWHASMLLLSNSIPFELKNVVTCCSTDVSSCSLVSPSISDVTARAYERGFTSNPVTMISFILVHCSRSTTRVSNSIIRLSFSIFCSLRAFTSLAVDLLVWEDCIVWEYMHVYYSSSSVDVFAAANLFWQYQKD